MFRAQRIYLKIQQTKYKFGYKRVRDQIKLTNWINKAKSLAVTFIYIYIYIIYIYIHILGQTQLLSFLNNREDSKILKSCK